MKSTEGKTEAITEETVEYVAKLANLEVPESERAELALQLSRILEHVQQLNKLDVSGVEPTTQLMESIKHAARDDRAVPRTGSGDAGKTVKHFKVPKVITER
jgi:aspartyl-tRNA(Asn)/glutamyl-tRNA(Gln) amidotransferase subunit C